MTARKKPTKKVAGKKGADPTAGGGVRSVVEVASPATTSPSSSGADVARDTDVVPRLSITAALAEARKSVAALNTAPHVEVPALAGTGKTTTAVEGLILVKGGSPRITPSPQQAEVWKALQAGDAGTVRYSAFNTAITDEAKRKLEAAGLHLKGVQGQGIHSLGRAALMRAFPQLRRFNLDNAKWVVRDQVAEALGGNWHDLRKTGERMRATMNAAEELVGLCKQTLTDPTREGLDTLTSHYDVDMEGADRKRLYEIVPAVLDAARDPKGRYTFDDMVWLPVVLGLPVERVDLQIVDESQDLNRMQQELMYRAGHRIVFVGDRHQAIYGFAGADAESMNRMRDTLAATERGLVSLPLTVTRRCGKAIVREAQKWVPEYEAHESNGEGSVGEARWPLEGPRDSRKELPWEQTYGPLVNPGAMVLCRVNAPLVSECFRFLSRGIKANIQGRKIGEGLVALVKKADAASVPELIKWVDGWLDREQQNEMAKKNPSEGRLDNLQDKRDCLVTFCEGQPSVASVVERIEQVFTDDQRNPGVKFSSGHKSKGLEADQVFTLHPPGVGPREDKMQAWELEQEDNLKYVMTTRAKEELVRVR